MKKKQKKKRKDKATGTSPGAAVANPGSGASPFYFGGIVLLETIAYDAFAG